MKHHLRHAELYEAGLWGLENHSGMSNVWPQNWLELKALEVTQSEAALGMPMQGMLMVLGHGGF